MKVSFDNQIFLPPSTIGIIGGGQLGQMLSQSAKSMGYKIGILDPTPDCPAAQVSDFQIVADYDDQDAILEMAQRCDLLTYEFENVDVTALDQVTNLVALPQGTDLLRITGNRFSEKSFLDQNQIMVAPFALVEDEEQLNKATNQLGYPSILKTVDGGYDGHGQVDLNDATNLKDAINLLKTGTCILEKRLNFVMELSVMVTRSGSGEIRCFPVSENQHCHHILDKSIVPARVSSETQKQAQVIAKKIAQQLQLRGVLGIEFFLLENGQLIVNELAPRPHNSGHYSIEACNISQFEAHIRSICGLEIPKIQQIKSAVMVNLLGQHLKKARQRLPHKTTWHFHDYGKQEIKVDRKMGHITILGEQEQILVDIKKENIWEK